MTTARAIVAKHLGVVVVTQVLPTTKIPAEKIEVIFADINRKFGLTLETENPPKTMIFLDLHGLVSGAKLRLRRG